MITWKIIDCYFRFGNLLRFGFVVLSVLMSQFWIESMVNIHNKFNNNLYVFFSICLILSLSYMFEWTQLDALFEQNETKRPPLIIKHLGRSQSYFLFLFLLFIYLFVWSSFSFSLLNEGPNSDFVFDEIRCCFNLPWFSITVMSINCKRLDSIQLLWIHQLIIISIAKLVNLIFARER